MKAQDIVKKKKDKIFLKPTKMNRNQEYPHWNLILLFQRWAAD